MFSCAKIDEVVRNNGLFNNVLPTNPQNPTYALFTVEVLNMACDNKLQELFLDAEITRITKQKALRQKLQLKAKNGN